MSFSFFLAPIRGMLSFIGYVFNTIFWSPFLFLIALLKLLIPIKSWRQFCSQVLTYIANCWIMCNNINIRLATSIYWNLNCLEELSLKQSYLVVANHQSWVDILVLQKIFFRKIPFLKFFLKKELIWIPFLGLAWWALDFPFLKRYSSLTIKKYPHLKNKDLKIIKNICQKFKNAPVSIINFVEGTRFNLKKHRCQESIYTHLLKPKSGGIALVLEIMGERISHIINVTIAYPPGPKNYWAFLCGKISVIKVLVEVFPVNKNLLGDYINDNSYRHYFQLWLNTLWQEKDKLLDQIIKDQHISV